MKSYLIGASALVMALVTGASADAGPITKLEATAQCTTDATGGDGKRKACDSEIQTVRAPEGFVISQNSLSGGLTSANGSEKSCSVTWGTYVEVIPGVTQPTSMMLRAHARSPKGHWSGRGWATCRYTVNLVRLPSVTQ